MPELLSLGECMIELFADRPLAEATTLIKTFGGDTCNALVAAARLGTSTGFITRVGDDPFRDFLLHAWRREGIDTSLCRIVPGFNGLYLIALGNNGAREFIYYRSGSAASTLEPADLDQEALRQCRMLLVSGISQAISVTARAAVQVASGIVHRHGGDVAYDPNFRPRLWNAEEARAALTALLPTIAIALPSAPEESDLLLGVTDPAEIADFYLSHGVKIVAVKCGERGVFVADEGASCWVEAVPPRQVIDTSGAGDTFNGAFLHAILRGFSLRTAAQLGATAASLKVEGRGAVASQPRGPQVWERLKAYYG
ncbi:MAG: sugar kinase [Chloroflexi bacterium]|nr:sugar kinase [Chloroflexota bacterium]